MRRLAALLLLAASPVFAADWAAELDAGVAAHRRGDYQAAIQVFKPLAAQGSAIAETMLGVMAANGQGRAADPATAAAWWLRAAQRGYPPAQLALAKAMAAGRGVKADPGAAWVWASLAATAPEKDVAADAAALAAELARHLPPARLAELEAERTRWRPWAQ